MNRCSVKGCINSKSIRNGVKLFLIPKRQTHLKNAYLIAKNEKKRQDWLHALGIDPHENATFKKMEREEFICNVYISFQVFQI